MEAFHWKEANRTGITGEKRYTTNTQNKEGKKNKKENEWPNDFQFYL